MEKSPVAGAKFIGKSRDEGPLGRWPPRLLTMLNKVSARSALQVTPFFRRGLADDLMGRYRHAEHRLQIRARPRYSIFLQLLDEDGVPMATLRLSTPDDEAKRRSSTTTTTPCVGLLNADHLIRAATAEQVGRALPTPKSGQRLFESVLDRPCPDQR